MAPMVMVNKSVNPDLDRERKKASFNPREFADWWHEGANVVDTKRKIGAYNFTPVYYKLPTVYICRGLFPGEPGIKGRSPNALPFAQGAV